jgi:hypothetical protein
MQTFSALSSASQCRMAVLRPQTERQEWDDIASLRRSFFRRMRHEYAERSDAVLLNEGSFCVHWLHKASVTVPLRMPEYKSTAHVAANVHLVNQRIGTDRNGVCADEWT